MLGVVLEVAVGRMWLADEKRRLYLRRLETALESGSIPRKEMERLLGRLQFAAACYPVGRTWLHAPWRAMRARYRLAGDEIILSKKARRGLELWAAQLRLEVQEGVPLACIASIGPVGAPGVGAIYADASGSVGWAAWSASATEVLVCYGDWDETERPLGICEKELYASTVGLVTLARELSLTSVWSFTDNNTALAAMQSCTPGTARLQELVERRIEWMRRWGIREAAARVGTKSNLWADLGSRGRMHDVVSQAKALGYNVRVLTPPEEWRSAAWLGEIEGDTTVSLL
jgi:hypothetical protein